MEVAGEVEKGWDPPLAYLEGILKLVREGVITDLTASRLREIGASVEMFKGLPEMFIELDQVLANQPQLKDAGIKLEHYLVSGGIGDLLRGLKVASHMTEIFGCEFDFDPESGKAVTVKSSVSFTEKTKFIYAVNKGITGLPIHTLAGDDFANHFRNVVRIDDGEIFDVS